MTAPAQPEETKVLFTAILGRANAGKSSLLNALVGERIAAVSPKPQTTRTRITGILNVGLTQLIFVDTPGLHRSRDKLGEEMLRAASGAIAGTDAVIFMRDVTAGEDAREESLLKSVRERKIPLLYLLNKIDLLADKKELMPMLARVQRQFEPEAIIPLSVTRNDGVEDVREELLRLAKSGPRYFPEDMLTDQPERVLAAEMLREQLLNLLRDEVPHGIAVVAESFSERADRDLLDISLIVYCEKESHKRIIIGKNGEMLKKASSAARANLEKFFQIKVNLRVWVKVKENWRNRGALIEQFGLSADGPSS